MEWWQFVALLCSIGALLTPMVIAAGNRDRSLLAIIAQNKDDSAKAVAIAKEDASKAVKAAVDTAHDRINRVRDEYVRRDDLNAHLARMDKQLDELKQEMKEGNNSAEKKLEEIRRLILERKATP